MKTRRVGTVTLGAGLILFGLLFISRIFTQVITYEFAFNLWPVIFILLGCEILVVYFRDKEGKMIYDKGAILLIMILTFFAMSMAGAQFIFEHAEHIYFK